MINSKFLLFLLWFVFYGHTLLYSQVSISSTSPNISDISSNIDTFEIKVHIDSVKDLSLGDKITITLPENIPSVSLQDNDDGKLYVSVSFKNSKEDTYKKAPGIKILAYEHIVSIKFTSKIQTFVKNDIYENLLPILDGDNIIFTFSATSNVSNKAPAQYEDDGIIKASSNSDTLQIFNNTQIIKTPSLDLGITNPSIVFDKTGLGAKSNPKFSFFFKGGLDADVRIEIVFPDGFIIDSLNNSSNYIVLNRKYKTSKAIVDGQKLSFLLKEKITNDNIEIYTMSYRITNSPYPENKPFKINIYKNDKFYESSSIYPKGISKKTFFVNHNELEKYSLDDEIHFEFTKPVLLAYFLKENITLEQDYTTGRTFGANYRLLAVNPEYGYASKFKILVGLDVNLTSGLDFNISINTIVTKDGHKPLEDIVFQVPDMQAKEEIQQEKTIIQTHSKLFAKNEIDMLYAKMDNKFPDKALYNDLIFDDVDKDGIYSKKDTFIITFSKDVYSPYIEDISNIVNISGSVYFGESASVKKIKRTTSLYYKKYIITLGLNPILNADDIFAYKRSKVLSKDGSVPMFDVVFSPIPTLSPPKQKSKFFTYDDNDDNGRYSSEDKIFIEFTQPIKSIDLKSLSLENGALLDAKYVIYTNTLEGYSSKLAIKLGENTQLKAGDNLLIPNNSIENKHKIKAGNNGYMKFEAPDMTRLAIISYEFISKTNTISLNFNKNISTIKDHDNVLKNIIIKYDDKNSSLFKIKEKLISLKQNNNNLSLVFNNKFIANLKEAKLSLILLKNTLLTKNSLRGNKKITTIFYTSIEINNLVANSWNLIALQDKMVDTNIRNIKDTNLVNSVFVFDVDTNNWLTKDYDVAKRGDALWVNPKQENITSILAVKPVENFIEKTTLLTRIFNMEKQVAYYVGHSAKDCEKSDSFSVDDVYKILTDVTVKFIGFDSLSGEYNAKRISIKPCLGFMVYKEEKITPLIKEETK